MGLVEALTHRAEVDGQTLMPGFTRTCSVDNPSCSATTFWLTHGRFSAMQGASKTPSAAWTRVRSARVRSRAHLCRSTGTSLPACWVFWTG